MILNLECSKPGLPRPVPKMRARGHQNKKANNGNDDNHDEYFRVVEVLPAKCAPRFESGYGLSFFGLHPAGQCHRCQVFPKSLQRLDAAKQRSKYRGVREQDVSGALCIR